MLKRLILALGPDMSLLNKGARFDGLQHGKQQTSEGKPGEGVLKGYGRTSIERVYTTSSGFL